MSKVVNSVQQIVAECNKMLAQTEECEFIDVKSLAKTLKDESEELEKLYNEHPDEEREISMKKSLVEGTAIRLEFYMDVRLGLYTERRKLRAYAETLYKDCRDVCDELSTKKGMKDSAGLLEWGSLTRWAIEFYARSYHVIFETDEDDEQMIKKIVEAMKLYKEEKE
jgi:hypothetical protein